MSLILCDFVKHRLTLSQFVSVAKILSTVRKRSLTKGIRFSGSLSVSVIGMSKFFIGSFCFIFLASRCSKDHVFGEIKSLTSYHELPYRTESCEIFNFIFGTIRVN